MYIICNNLLISAVASSSVPPGSCASSTYIRSQYNLNPPPVSSSGRSIESPHSPDPLPGYNYGPPESEGPPSTIGDFNWANTTTSSIDGGSSCNGPGCHPGSCQPTNVPPTYLSSALSTSSADSGSASGSGSRACSGSGSGSGGGSRRPSQLKSFSQPAGISQPKAVFGE